MTNPSQLNQHLLRTILLEGENEKKIFSAVRAYQSSDQTEEDRAEVMDTVRKEITKTTRELLADDQVSLFLDELDGLV
jgi:hypothetical protein